MREDYTAGASRALRKAAARAIDRQSPAVEPIDLLAGLVDDAESRAAALLTEIGVESERLLAELGVKPVANAAASEAEEFVEPPRSPLLRDLLNDAALAARAFDRGREVGTEHLLAAAFNQPGPIAQALERLGFDPRRLPLPIDRVDAREVGPIAVEDDLPSPWLSDPREPPELARLLDASANRASEGLRVAEDYVRFVLDEPFLTRRLKDVRHRLSAAVRGIDAELLIASRDVRGDVGTHIMTPEEMSRGDVRAVLSANFKRAQQALRTLEEYSKLLNPWLAGRFEVLRYDLYALEKLTLSAVSSLRTLEEVNLYVLAGGLPTLGDLVWIVGEALEGGAKAVQLREKNLPDREILNRAAAVRKLTGEAGARFILNDRPDLAVLSGADGVHLGQDDLSVRLARRVIGPNALVGVSTHDAEQLDRAVLDGGSYFGVGPVFPSPTKKFDDYAGLEFVRHAAETTKLPWFAIGGITLENLDALLEAGASRVAVSSAIVRADKPRAAARKFVDRLRE